MTRALVAMLLSLAAAVPARAGGTLRPGDPFPAWELVDQGGAKVSSRDLAGKTYLVWFYPKAMTPACTAEGIGLRDHIEEFRKQGIEVLGVSFDAPAQNAAFVARERFPFRLLSDRDRRLAVAVGAADSPTAPFAKRISYLVGPDGKVVEAYPAVNPRSHAVDVLAGIEAKAPPTGTRE